MRQLRPVAPSTRLPQQSQPPHHFTFNRCRRPCWGGHARPATLASIEEVLVTFQDVLNPKGDYFLAVQPL